MFCLVSDVELEEPKEESAMEDEDLGSEISKESF